MGVRANTFNQITSNSQLNIGNQAVAMTPPPLVSQGEHTPPHSPKVSFKSPFLEKIALLYFPKLTNDPIQDNPT